MRDFARNISGYDVNIAVKRVPLGNQYFESVEAMVDYQKKTYDSLGFYMKDELDKWVALVKKEIEKDRVENEISYKFREQL